MTNRDPQELQSGHIARLTALLLGALSPPPGRFRIFGALAAGAICHVAFALAVLSMIGGMYFGMSLGLGQVPWPWALLANGALLIQFPLGHSLLLTDRGRAWLCRLPVAGYAATLSTTTYAAIASFQLLALFVLWTPSGIVLWEATGTTLTLLQLAYAGSWLLLIKASFDAGPEVQSGALGWLSMLQNKRPVYPDMPVTGLFRFIRQPIYVAFTLTLWTVPVWTPDQLALAISFTAYCVVAPRLKEQRFAKFYRDRFDLYRERVPYMIPRLPRPVPKKRDELKASDDQRPLTRKTS